MIGGENGVVCSYDLSTHDLIDVWSVGAKITALACLSLEEGGLYHSSRHKGGQSNHQTGLGRDHT